MSTFYPAKAAYCGWCLWCRVWGCCGGSRLARGLRACVEFEWLMMKLLGTQVGNDVLAGWQQLRHQQVLGVLQDEQRDLFRESPGFTVELGCSPGRHYNHLSWILTYTTHLSYSFLMVYSQALIVPKESSKTAVTPWLWRCLSISCGGTLFDSFRTNASPRKFSTSVDSDTPKASTRSFAVSCGFLLSRWRHRHHWAQMGALTEDDLRHHGVQSESELANPVRGSQRRCPLPTFCWWGRPFQLLPIYVWSRGAQGLEWRVSTCPWLFNPRYFMSTLNTLYTREKKTTY